MSVISFIQPNYHHLNHLRPLGARFGEVTAIELIHSYGFGLESVCAYSKRKSIHVPPSSNAYWNAVNLLPSVRCILAQPRYDRVRAPLLSRFIEIVGEIHAYSLAWAYGTFDGTQVPSCVSTLDEESFHDDYQQYVDLVFCQNDDADVFWDGWLIRIS